MWVPRPLHQQNCDHQCMSYQDHSTTQPLQRGNPIIIWCKCLFINLQSLDEDCKLFVHHQRGLDVKAQLSKRLHMKEYFFDLVVVDHTTSYLLPAQ